MSFRNMDSLVTSLGYRPEFWQTCLHAPLLVEPDLLGYGGTMFSCRLIDLFTMMGFHDENWSIVRKLCSKAEDRAIRYDMYTAFLEVLRTCPLNPDRDSPKITRAESIAHRIFKTLEFWYPYSTRDDLTLISHAVATPETGISFLSAVGFDK